MSEHLSPRECSRCNPIECPCPCHRDSGFDVATTRGNGMGDDLARALLLHTALDWVQSCAAADAVLASGVLDRIRADAWDEGHNDWSVTTGHVVNPYRSEARDG